MAKAKDMHVMATMAEYRQKAGITYDTMQSRVNKQASSFKRIFNENLGSCTMLTAYDAAEALDGIIVFLTDSQYNTYRRSEEFRIINENLTVRLRSAESELDSLRARLAKLKAENEKLSDRVEKQDSRIEKLISTTTSQQEALMRKDFQLAKFLIKD